MRNFSLVVAVLFSSELLLETLKIKAFLAALEISTSLNTRIPWCKTATKLNVRWTALLMEITSKCTQLKNYELSKKGFEWIRKRTMRVSYSCERIKDKKESSLKKKKEKKQDKSDKHGVLCRFCVVLNDLGDRLICRHYVCTERQKAMLLGGTLILTVDSGLAFDLFCVTAA